MKDSMDKQIIPVVLATDEKYVPYLGVTVQSIIENASSDRNYRIFILGQRLSENDVESLKQLERNYARVEVIDVTEIMSNYTFKNTKNHLSQATSVRLSLEILYSSGTIISKYNKLLYIDSDVVVLRDVAELYREELGNCILGAVRGHVARGTEANMMKYFPLRYGSRDYFNAGILLLNMQVFCREHIGTQGLLMLQEDENQIYINKDQEVLNILCEGRVKFFDVRWNYEWAYEFPGDSPATMEKRKRIKNKEELGIVHYTTPRKPWNSKGYTYGELFWKYARRTGFYKDILAAYLRGKIDVCPKEVRDINFALREKYVRGHIFPFNKIEKNEKIVLIGSRKIINFYLFQLKHIAYAQIMAIISSDFQEHGSFDIEVVSMKDLGWLNYDKIVICENSNEAGSIVGELLNEGINQEHIVFGN